MRVVVRTVEVLEFLSEHPEGIGVMKLADALGEAPPTVHRVLATLLSLGYVTQDPVSRRYLLGAAVMRLGQAFLQRDNLVASGSPFLRDLAARTLESVFLNELIGDDVVCVASAESPRPLSIYMKVGQRTPYHAGSSARAILAYQPPERQRLLLEKERRQRFTPLTPITVADALSELERTRSRGYALCDQEMEEGITAVSVPIRDAEGRVTASLTIVGPQDRLASAEVREGTARLLADTAAAIHDVLSASPASFRPAIVAQTRHVGLEPAVPKESIPNARSRSRSNGSRVVADKVGNTKGIPGSEHPTAEREQDSSVIPSTSGRRER